MKSESKNVPKFERKEFERKEFVDGGEMDALDAEFWGKELARATGSLREWRDKTVVELRTTSERKAERKAAKAGRKPFPVEKRRTTRITVCFNADEAERVREYVGDRETGEALRELILGALNTEKTE